MKDKKLKKHFKRAFQLTTPLYVNYVGAFLRFDASPQQLRKNMLDHQVLKQAYERNKLRFNIRSLPI